MTGKPSAGVPTRVSQDLASGAESKDHCADTAQQSQSSALHDDAAQPHTPSQRPSTSAAAVASELVAGTAAHDVDHYVRALADAKESVWTQAARVVEETANQKPELLAPYIERLVGLLASDRPRVAQASAHALPQLARVAPAKVAKQLDKLRASWPSASPVAKDGLVRTFVALCVASVIYQKRLIDRFEAALAEADEKTLPRWVEAILPALKGEPYAQARTVVEKRLADTALPRPVAQRIADGLGLKLRVVR